MIAALLAIGCGVTPKPITNCTPGVVESCPCAGGGSGAQRCDDQGSAFGACECAGNDAGADAAADHPRVDATVCMFGLDCDGNGTCESPIGPVNCGACGNACTAGQQCLANGGGVFRCVASSCPLSVYDCDGNSANGCETAASPTNCGGCGARCPDNYACRSATAGVAAQCFACPSGQAPCGAACVALGASVTNCGACGNACDTPVNGTAMCSGGSCRVGSCAAGYADCNGAFSDGCEIDLRSTTANCGACRHVCNAGLRCVAGVCQ